MEEGPDNFDHGSGGVADASVKTVTSGSYAFLAVAATMGLLILAVVIIVAVLWCRKRRAQPKPVKPRPVTISQRRRQRLAFFKTFPSLLFLATLCLNVYTMTTAIRDLMEFQSADTKGDGHYTFVLNDKAVQFMLDKDSFEILVKDGAWTADFNPADLVPTPPAAYYSTNAFGFVSSSTVTYFSMSGSIASYTPANNVGLAQF